MTGHDWWGHDCKVLEGRAPDGVLLSNATQPTTPFAGSYVAILILTDSDIMRIIILLYGRGVTRSAIMFGDAVLA